MRKPIDLVVVNPKCMSALIEKNWSTIYSFETKSGMYEYLVQLFTDNALDTPASRRLLDKVKNSKALSGAQFVIANSMLAGRGMETVK